MAKDKPIIERRGRIEEIVMLFLASLMGAIASDVIPTFKETPLIFQAYGLIWFLSACVLLYIAADWIRLFKIKIGNIKVLRFIKKNETLLLVIFIIILLVIVFLSPFWVMEYLKSLL